MLDAPFGLTASLTADKLVELHWADNESEERGYVIERSVAGEPFVLAGHVGANMELFYDSAFLYTTLNALVQYRVRATWFDDVYSGPSNIAQLQVDVTGLEKKMVLRVFPQPASEAVHIESKLPIQKVLMTNTSGQPIHQRDNINQLSYDVAVRDLPAGVYIVHVETDEGVLLTKVVVVH